MHWKITLMIVCGGLLAGWLAGREALRLKPAQATESPAPRAYPPGDLGRIVKLGEAIVAKTDEHPLSKGYVGNGLRCTSCHLENGTHPTAASFLGVATAYPAWAPREKRVITLEDRILNCFMRSMNGVRPPLGSEVSVAVAAYITWLSAGEPLSMNPDGPFGPRRVRDLPPPTQPADPKRGAMLYAKQCAECHADDGQGSADGPPVWGEKSFNDGAGLSHDDKLAAWLKVSMPLGDAQLTDQEAFDIAAYVNAHPRAKFDLKEHLPPDERLGEYNGLR